jgi:hypothetical protein
MTTQATSKIWRHTDEHGYRYSVLLSTIEEMRFEPPQELDSGNGTLTRCEASWNVYFASKRNAHWPDGAGQSLHDAWMHHLESQK